MPTDAISDKRFAIVFVPYLQNLSTLPLAPAVLNAILVDAGASNIKFHDANLSYQEMLEQAAPEVSQELFRFSQSSSCYRLSAQAASEYYEWLNKTVGAILKNDPTHVLISVFSFLGQKFTEDICFMVKEKAPQVHITVGGQGANVMLSDLNKYWFRELVDSALIDCATVGDAELTLLNAINSSKQVIQADQQTNKQLSDSLTPNLSIFDNLNYYKRFGELTVPITFSKGCIKKCVFCDVEAQWPKFRVATGLSTADKIAAISNEHNVKQFYFTDNLVNGNCKELRMLCNKLIELNNNLKLSGNFIFRSER